MVLIRTLRAHLDTLLAVGLAAAYVVESILRPGSAGAEPLISSIHVADAVALAVGLLFLLSLAFRSRVPLVPLGLALVAAWLAGRGSLDASWSLLAGLLLAVYSTGAWAGGRAGQVGALGVGVLVGITVLRSAGDTLEARAVAVPAIVLVGAWLLGLAARSLRLGRSDGQRNGLDWNGLAAAPDSAGRDETVRELRDVIERSMSTVVLQARHAHQSLPRDPDAVRRALSIIEAAGTEALEETQRLTGLLLSPDGAPLPEPRAGLADLDYLAEQVADAGLPVAIRVEGEPLPLTSDLDAAAYRVVHEALMSTLHHSQDARADVVVRYLHDELQIEVTDDGRPADDADPTQETAGLMAARDEVAAIGGTLDAGPRPGRGYWVMARLPYEPDWS